MDIKRYRNITFSVVAHAIILYWLSTADMTLPQQKKEIPPKFEAIKSYIYHAPPKKLVLPLSVPVSKEKLKETVKEVIVVEPKKIKKQRDNQVKKKVVKIAEEKKNINKQPKNKTITNISPQEMIGNLRKSINKNIAEQEVNYQQQFRSASVMHKQQNPVPSSPIQLTAEQKRQKNTMRMSEAISITKLDNGYCIIERGKQLGIDIPPSASMFPCGESNFDKSFREHMERVRRKINNK